MINNYKFTLTYVLSILLINIGFVYVPLIPLLGTMYPPMTIAVGLIFVLRDFAQREIKHKVIFAMLIGAILSYFMADPFVALASFVAFFVSEIIDWAIYSFTGKTFEQRIFYSSLISTPIDSALFLYMIGHFSLVATFLMFISKMIGAIVIYYFLKRK